MFSKGPKNTKQYHWTEHVKFKMQHYGLSAQKILGVISRPARLEEGIVKNTIAVMKPINSKIVNNKPVWKQEIWVMYQKKNSKSKNNLTPTLSLSRRGSIKIISAWRYPGVSPKRNPIPEEILNEVANME